jgi:hypothetical protein
MSEVILEPAAGPTLDEYLQAVAGQPLEEQESAEGSSHYGVA